MKKPTLTTAQKREAMLQDFNRRYIQDEATARMIINSYYRLCALSLRVMEMQNNRDYSGSAYLEEQEEKEERHAARLNSYLLPYKLQLDRSNPIPVIYQINEAGEQTAHAFFKEC